MTHSPTEDHTRSLSRSSSQASNLSRWSRKTGTNTPAASRRGSLVDAPHDPHAPPDGRDPLKGHLGHLTEQQDLALAQFKDELMAKDIYDPNEPREEGGARGRGRVHDSTLLRFLRARKFDVAGAVKQYSDFLDWREKKGVDERYENFDVEGYEELRRLYPMWTGRRDLRGIPVYVYKISALTPAKLSKMIPTDDLSSSSIAVITLALIRFLLPLSSALPRDHEETPVSGTNSIIDVGSVGLSRFWGLRTHLQVASQVASANFPETIDRVFVVGAPSFFPTVFNWAKKWFDPGTVDKIHILSHDSLPTLLTMMPRSSIPKEYGGDLDWAYGDDPNLDDAARKLLGGEWVHGPLIWNVHQSRYIPVGTVNGKRRDEGLSLEGAHSDSEGEKERGRIRSSTITSQSSAGGVGGMSVPIMASQIPPGTSSTTAHPADGAHRDHLPNGTSPDPIPTPPPTSRVIPGTTEPVMFNNGVASSSSASASSPSSPTSPGRSGSSSGASSPTRQRSGHSDHGLERRVQNHNEAVKGGWVPGSGISEEEFLRHAVHSLHLEKHQE